MGIIMKILDRYILTTYLKTFMSVFVILMLIFVLQAVWLYITELAGKDLAVSVIMKFLVYVTPTLIPLILPLTILLSSIMVFGQFAENYEFAAMKSTGISLQRAMRGLGIFIFFLGIVTFFFSNNVIPWANYNFYNLRKNIAQVQPAMAIAEGQFNEIGDYNIKVGSKSGDKGEFLHNVVIHKKDARRSQNRTVMIAEDGELISSPESNILQLVLYKGNYYQEIYNDDVTKNRKKPHAKSFFETYSINVDLEGLNDVDIDDKSYDTRYNMLDMYDLSYTIDSLYERDTKSYNNFSDNLYDRSSISILGRNMNVEKDTIYEGDILKLFELSTRLQIINLALNSANSSSQIISSSKMTFANDTKWRNKHVISLHEKYVLGFACVILFFVGAPLGALIRKGGIGLPLVIAILLFLSYHFIGIFAKNSSLDGSLNPIFATWLSTLIMLPLSIFLTTRATNDRGLLEFDHIIEPIKKLLSIKSRDERETTRLEQLKLDKATINTIQEKTDFETVSIANEQQLNTRYLSYKQWTKAGLVMYGLSALALLLFFVCRNNKLPETAHVSAIVSAILAGLMVICFIMATLKMHSMYALHSEKKITKNPIIILLAVVFFPLTYFFRRNKIDEDFSRWLK